METPSPGGVGWGWVVCVCVCVCWGGGGSAEYSEAGGGGHAVCAKEKTADSARTCDSLHKLLHVHVLCRVPVSVSMRSAFKPTVQ